MRYVVLTRTSTAKAVGLRRGRWVASLSKKDGVTQLCAGRRAIYSTTGFSILIRT
jgi:hypothetical protein